MTTSAAPFFVKDADELRDQPAEYRDLIRKIVVSHALNELTGATLYDEPAVAFAPSPYWKWLTCRVAMEEYGHHVRFSELGRAMGIDEADMVPGKTAKKSLSIFDYKLANWTEFCVMKMLGDLAEILQVEDLLKCSYAPLRQAARITMPEEKFHAKFGEDSCTEIAQTEAGRAELQVAIDRIFPMLPAFFGRAKSKNNEAFRKWGIKERTNEDMRADYMERCRVLVVDKLRLVLPHVEFADLAGA